MAAVKLRGDLPPGAVRLTDSEALVHQIKLIQSWHKQSEVWILRWGSGCLGAAAALSGMYLNSYYRRKLKLRHIGFVTTYMPIIAIPGMLATLGHRMFVTQNLILEKMECPVCLQARAAALQTGLGTIHPVLLAPFSALMYAVRHATVRLPDITKDWKGSIAIVWKLTRPIGTNIAAIFVIQALLGSYITYLEAKSYYNMKNELLKIRSKYEDNDEYIME